MRGLKEGLLSGVSGIVGFLLALLVSAIWGGTIGLVLFSTQVLHSARPQTWDEIALGWGVFSAVITFIFETPIARWLYRFMDGLQQAFGLISFIIVVPVNLVLLLGRVCLSWIPVKILSVILARFAEKMEAICQYAGSVIASQQVNLDDVVVRQGDEVMRIGEDWKIYRNNACWGWVDRSGRIYKDTSVQHRIIDPDLPMGIHPSGAIDDNKVFIANAPIGTIRAE